MGDRERLILTRIREAFQPARLDWISALKTWGRRPLCKTGTDEIPVPLVPEALIPDVGAKSTGSDFPGERLVVCLPQLQAEWRRQRKDLPKFTDRALNAIVASERSGRWKGRELTDRWVSRGVNRRQVAKPFDVEVTDSVCVIHTSRDAASLGVTTAVDALQSLAGAECAFRNVQSDRRIRSVSGTPKTGAPIGPVLAGMVRRMAPAPASCA